MEEFIYGKPLSTDDVFLYTDSRGGEGF